MVGKSATPVPAVPVQIAARVLSRIVVGHRLGFGARVLLVGCGNGELASFLEDISFEVSGIDDSLASIDEARSLFPHLEFHSAHPSQPVPIELQQFDLVLVQNSGAYTGNLLGLPARLATAQLLACLKPGGHAVFVRPFGDETAGASQHTQDCWARHLACFPGDAHLASYTDPWFSRTTWEWLRGRSHRRGFHAVTLCLPPHVIADERWRGFASTGLLTGHAECCSVATTSAAAEEVLVETRVA